MKNYKILQIIIYLTWFLTLVLGSTNLEDFDNDDDQDFNIMEFFLNDEVPWEVKRPFVNMLMRSYLNGSVATDLGVNLDHIRDTMEDGKDWIHTFVTSRQYDVIWDKLIGETIKVIKSVLQIAPLNEWKDIILIVFKNPAIFKPFVPPKDQWKFLRMEELYKNPRYLEIIEWAFDNPSSVLEEFKKLWISGIWDDKEDEGR